MRSSICRRLKQSRNAFCRGYRPRQTSMVARSGVACCRKELFSAFCGPLRIGLVLLGVFRRGAGAARFLITLRFVVPPGVALQACGPGPQAEASQGFVEFALSAAIAAAPSGA